MPKFKIGGSYGCVGTDWEDIVEAEDLEEAEDMAKEQTLSRVEWWAVLDEKPNDEEQGKDDSTQNR